MLRLLRIVSKVRMLRLLRIAESCCLKYGRRKGREAFVVEGFHLRCPPLLLWKYNSVSTALAGRKNHTLKTSTHWIHTWILFVRKSGIGSRVAWNGLLHLATWGDSEGKHVPRHGEGSPSAHVGRASEMDRLLCQSRVLRRWGKWGTWGKWGSKNWINWRIF